VRSAVRQGREATPEGGLRTAGNVRLGADVAFCVIMTRIRRELRVSVRPSPTGGREAIQSVSASQLAGGVAVTWFRFMTSRLGRTLGDGLHRATVRQCLRAKAAPFMRSPDGGYRPVKRSAGDQIPAGCLAFVGVRILLRQMFQFCFTSLLNVRLVACCSVLGREGRPGA